MDNSAQIFAGLIIIGEEILIGQVTDTNSGWIARRLNEIGIRIGSIHTVSDESNAILDVLEKTLESSSIILMTGGLGPTKDDITKKTLCDFFNCQLVQDADSLENIRRIFSERNLQITPINEAQANVPEVCKTLLNLNGTAPGMWFDYDDKIIVSMPGVPYEMKGIMESHVIPGLKQKFLLPPVIHETILTQGIGESWLSDRIEEWELKLPSHIRLAYLPSPGLVRLRLSAFGKSESQLRAEMNNHVHELEKLISPFIYGRNDDRLESVAGRLLKDNSKSLSVAESCTGGELSHKITSVAGCSDYFIGSVIAYSNHVKVAELGVKKSSIEKYGAVSEIVAKEMASGIRKKFNSDYAIATTGVAGPGGGTSDKPVGTVWIAVEGPERVESKMFQLGVSRERNILEACQNALHMLIKMIRN
ncbi:MAG: competence/damage-inducible protein A [Bacteroidetes bacterium]|nr:MAG: competence/damage-inducible protein A [Bacteroidota bacterium]REK00066.1 MAG: competence/damage-inducible protein A [Bacteroidota bacterium]REK34286.1 MAG: competence/damage-inducible protein A [Bacteroidota bacterium]REK50696.1 MAG: competence/damage-inducible protein A [Bacteroidota bacterium]